MKYEFSKYVDHGRWASYYEQIDLCLSFQPRSILVIGKGDGLVSYFLEWLGYKITTYDFEEDLEPDIRGDIREIENKVHEEYDVVLCCQVLEHIPFEHFEPTIDKLQKIAKHGLIISLPSVHFQLGLRLYAPHLGYKKSRLYYPNCHLKHQYDGEHYWEMGKKNYEYGKIKKILLSKCSKLKVIRPDNEPHHVFFILYKIII